MNALFCQKAKLGAVDALLNDFHATKSSNPRPKDPCVTIWFRVRARVQFCVLPSERNVRNGGTVVAKQGHLFRRQCGIEPISGLFSDKLIPTFDRYWRFYRHFGLFNNRC